MAAINAKDILLAPYTFPFGKEHKLGIPEKRNLEDPLRQIRLQSYLSTPCFIKCLTDISAKLSEMKGSIEEKRRTLIRDLV